MASHFSGPVISTNGFTGDVTGNQTGGRISSPTAYGLGSLAISPSVFAATISGSAAGSFTLAAPGAANVGHIIEVYNSDLKAHVVTVTGLVGGTTMTSGSTAGAAFSLFASGSAAWLLKTNTGFTQSA